MFNNTLIPVHPLDDSDNSGHPDIVEQAMKFAVAAKRRLVDVYKLPTPRSIRLVDISGRLLAVKEQAATRLPASGVYLAAIRSDGASIIMKLLAY